MKYFFLFICRWQKGKIILLASLSCWIIFTLPLGFVQPPPTSCMIRVNDTPYLEASNREQRMKRSTDHDELYYSDEKDEYLEVASNVVFERLRRNTDDNEISDPPKEAGARETNSVRDVENDGAYHSKYNRLKRQAPTTDDSNVEDLKYKQLVFEDNTGNSDAKTIDLETLQAKNRPADVLEYKRFMKVHAFFFFCCFEKIVTS